MSSVYNVTELVGTSPDSWEDAARGAVERAAKTLRDLRVAEVVTMDIALNDQGIAAFRVRLRISFKLEGDAPS